MGVPNNPASNGGSSRKHLLIAGTGRAGTSFMVRLLTDLGLDTHLSRFGDGGWDEMAQAGLEKPDLRQLSRSPLCAEITLSLSIDRADARNHGDRSGDHSGS